MAVRIAVEGYTWGGRVNLATGSLVCEVGLLEWLVCQVTVLHERTW